MVSVSTQQGEPRRVGFIGKIPACGDFVRQHIGNKVSSELERWLSISSQNLYHGKHTLGAECVRFVFSAHGCSEVAIGSLIKSSDRVGRHYPLAVFTSLSAGDLMAQLASVPAAYADFLTNAEQLLLRAADLSLDQLRELVTALAPPSEAQERAVAQRVEAQLSAIDAATTLDRALQGLPSETVYYALLTLCTATAPVQQAAPSGPPTVLDCPLERELGPALWLALAAARLRWTAGAVSLLWTSGDAPRLLLALGAASDQLLVFAAARSHHSARLWPLTTDRAEAISRARTSLTAAVGDLSPQAPAPRASLAELRAQLTRVSC
jgi:type VI secretion system protein ImpM